MKSKNFSHISQSVSCIGFGTMHLTFPSDRGENKGIELIHTALDEGVTLMDCSNCYSSSPAKVGQNEELIRNALDSYHKDTSHITIITKGGLYLPANEQERNSPFPHSRNSKPEYIYDSICRSSETLRQAIPLWLHHAPDGLTPIEATLEAAFMAKTKGLVKNVGVSNYSFEELLRAEKVGSISCVQNKFNPWELRDRNNGILNYCENKNILYLSWRPLGTPEERAFLNIPYKSSYSLEQLILAWQLRQSPVIVPIPGTINDNHLRLNCRASKIKDEEYFKIFDSISLNRPPYKTLQIRTRP